MKKKRYFIAIIILLLLGFMGGCTKKGTEPIDKPEPSEVQYKLSDFSSAETCKACHPNHYNEWKGSMHAYAFMDPVNTIRIQRLHTTIGPEQLGDFCVQCHSPIGVLTGETSISFQKENVDPLVREGITCEACHLMEKFSATTADEAIYHYDVASGTRYGPIIDPATSGFHSSKGLLFFSRSDACLPCHDLINKTGLLAEITFTEWLKSPFSAMGVECQDCHMESYSGQAAVNGPQRNNLHRHDFIGVDVAFIDNFPNKAEQRQKIEKLLQNSVTMRVNIPDFAQPNSTLRIEAIVKNDKTGHDIPSAVTFVRQMWLEVTVTNGTDTLYQSGHLDANGDLMDEHSELNPNGDPDLALFQSALYKNGERSNVFEADSIRIGSIGPFKSKTSVYSIALPSNIRNTIDVKVRLRFRTFPPYSIREDAPELIDRIPIFEMEQFEGTVTVAQ